MSRVTKTDCEKWKALPRSIFPDRYPTLFFLVNFSEYDTSSSLNLLKIPFQNNSVNDDLLNTVPGDIHYNNNSSTITVKNESETLSQESSDTASEKTHEAEQNDFPPSDVIPTTNSDTSNPGEKSTSNDATGNTDEIEKQPNNQYDNTDYNKKIGITFIFLLICSASVFEIIRNINNNKHGTKSSVVTPLPEPDKPEKNISCNLNKNNIDMSINNFGILRLNFSDCFKQEAFVFSYGDDSKVEKVVLEEIVNDNGNINFDLFLGIQPLEIKRKKNNEYYSFSLEKDLNANVFNNLMKAAIVWGDKKNQDLNKGKVKPLYLRVDESSKPIVHMWGGKKTKGRNGKEAYKTGTGFISSYSKYEVYTLFLNEKNKVRPTIRVGCESEVWYTGYLLKGRNLKKNRRVHLLSQHCGPPRNDITEYVKTSFFRDLEINEK